ncbi:hypothetical protein [Methylobacterium sp. WL120]|uniref:hypothetical protein n=1 Tax=Methylobacterium sp. WL120 TaxID=2603887 RepID=UPI0011C884EA|nr:hypothetical protein [Methylobacterium sp. WL120]TXM66739.1 hypothetical protein FV229_11850 [Methylobacterium sp. WL120]
MIDLALDPSETRSAASATPRSGVRRPWARIALFGALGLGATGAFAGVASTYLSGLAGPQRAKPIAMSQKAADWPDLKDGMPALAGSGPAVPKIREILPPEPATAPVVEARVDPILRAGNTAADTVTLPVAPARAVPGVAPLAAETVRAKTETTTYAALPPEPPKAIVAKPAATKDEAIRHEGAKPEVTKLEISKPEAVKAKPRIEAHAKPTSVPASKAVAGKPAALKPVAVEAKAAETKLAPAQAQDEDTEVFGIKVPSLAPAGRKIREGVEALGDAVKGIPDRF